MRMREASLVVIANPRAGDRLPVLLRRISLRLALLDEISRCYSSAQPRHQHGIVDPREEASFRVRSPGDAPLIPRPGPRRCPAPVAGSRPSAARESPPDGPAP